MEQPHFNSISGIIAIESKEACVRKGWVGWRVEAASGHPGGRVSFFGCWLCFSQLVKL